MLYLFDPQLAQLKHASIKDVLFATAKAIAPTSSYYKAQVLDSDNSRVLFTKEGKLPRSPAEKSKSIKALVDWIFQNKVEESSFALLLDNKPIVQEMGIAKLDYSYTPRCWLLNLLPSEFADLQEIFSRHNLPDDIFKQIY